MTLTGLALLLSMSLFFGLAFEELYGSVVVDRPGGIRTFPLLALAGGGLHALDGNQLPFSAGLLVVGAWQYAYDAQTKAPVEGRFIIPICNVFAYLLGALALSQEPWVVMAMTVAATLLLASRARLHTLAEAVPREEIFTAGQFLLLAGVLLPLLPDDAVAGFGALTPHKLALAVVAVSSLSYGGYLLERYARPKGATLLAGILGGLYSSTATTVVLAKRDRALSSARPLNVAIILATAMMYGRLLAVIFVFNHSLGFAMAVPLGGLLLLAIALAALAHVTAPSATRATPEIDALGNPLHIGTALLFTLLLVSMTLVSNWVKDHYGGNGITILATAVGLTDIDPFVLSIAQGSIADADPSVLIAAILFAASSNNAMKAIYALTFGGIRRMGVCASALAALSAVGIFTALHLTHP